MGEQLDTLSVKELQELEQQLENASKKVRSRKVKLFFHFTKLRAEISFYSWILQNTSMINIISL